MKAGTGGFLSAFAAMEFSMPDMQECPPGDGRAPAQEAQAVPGMHQTLQPLTEGRHTN